MSIHKQTYSSTFAHSCMDTSSLKRKQILCGPPVQHKTQFRRRHSIFKSADWLNCATLIAYNEQLFGDEYEF